MTEMNLETIRLSEISWGEKDDYLYKECKKYNKVVNITKNKQTHRCREQTDGSQWERGGKAIKGSRRYERLHMSKQTQHGVYTSGVQHGEYSQNFEMIVNRR